MPRRKSEAVLQKIVNEAQWMITAEEDMPVKRKLEREDRNNSSGGEEMPDVNVEYVVMDESHSQTDHVGRTRLAKFCGSRDDSLSWNLSRVKQDGAVRADDMDHKTAGNSGNTETGQTYDVHYAYSLGSEMYRRQQNF